MVEQVGKQVQLKNNCLYPQTFILECVSNLANKNFKVELMDDTIEASAVSDIKF